MGDHRVRRAVLADPGGQRAGVDAAEADDAACLQPGVEMLGGAVVGGIGDVGLEDDADRAVAGCRRQVFDVLVIGADIADMREGEGDDLAEIGGVGQDLLVAGQRRVEDHFGLHLAGGADALAFDDGAIGQNEQGGWFCGGPGRCRGHCLHPVQAARWRTFDGTPTGRFGSQAGRCGRWARAVRPGHDVGAGDGK